MCANEHVRVVRVTVFKKGCALAVPKNMFGGGYRVSSSKNPDFSSQEGIMTRKLRDL
jgi:hypothetical protein